jgi:glycosyltransferase involved in cell wall biosynthesis
MQWYYRLIPSIAARRAAAVITVSQASKAAIIHHLPISPERVFVTHEAANPVMRPVHERAHIDEVLGRYRLPVHFILAIGSADPRKNIAALLQAYAHLPAHIQERFLLAIVWTHNYLAPELAEQAAALGITHRLRFLERVPDEDLAALYSAASMFVFPSLYEGFGLPVLEAMSCGTPVIAADNSSIPEIAGDAALLVAAQDQPTIAAAITRVATDIALRERLTVSGLRQASRFSWAQCAHATIAVYERVRTPQLMAERAGG